MDQDNSYIEDNAYNENIDNENVGEENIDSELRNEWLKKVLVVLITILVLGGTYYYTIVSNKNKDIMAQKAAILKDLQIVKTSEKKDSKDTVPVNNAINQDKKMVKQETVPQDSGQALIKSNVIRPSNKAFVAKEALLAAGKINPFSSNATRPILSGKDFLPKYIGKNPLPNLPSLKGIPNIGSLPDLGVPNLTDGKAPQIAPQFYPEVKGFIGNKAIISINGISESLKANESFQDIKVLKVNPNAMTVKYVQNKQVITRNIKSLD